MKPTCKYVMLMGSTNKLRAAHLHMMTLEDATDRLFMGYDGAKNQGAVSGVGNTPQKGKRTQMTYGRPTSDVVKP